MAEPLKFLDYTGLGKVLQKIADLFVKKDGNKVLSDKNFSEQYETKLKNLKELTPATEKSLGGVIIGENLNITPEGVLSAAATPELKNYMKITDYVGLEAKGEVQKAVSAGSATTAKTAESATEAENATKFGNQLPEHYATKQSVVELGTAVDGKMTELTEVANGKTNTYVFDDYTSLETAINKYKAYIENPKLENPFTGETKLKTGDIFYIRATEVSDYWWDDTTKDIYPMEITKIELPVAIPDNEIITALNGAFGA